MNGAQALLRTLVGRGVDTCFMNPGTSEMHFVAALDTVPAMRSVLALFEGVATGAADGYARMAGRSATTLLHLGPGLGNGLANLHNARRAHSPVLNIVGDHATTHRRYDAPLQSDIETVARNVSVFVRTSTSTAALAEDALAALAVVQGSPGSVATLIVPADVSWSEGGVVRPPASASEVGSSMTARGADPSEDALISARAALRSREPAVILVGGRACSEAALQTVADIAAATGARLLAETFPARLARGAGRPPVERLAYLAEHTARQLEGTRHLVLVDAQGPVSFFASPDRPSDLVPSGCTVHEVAGPAGDLDAALGALAASLGVPRGPSCPTKGTPRDCSPRPPRPALPHTTGSASPAERSVKACRWHWAPPWPVPTGEWWPSSRTEAPCTRYRPGGPWPERASTSPRCS